ncbi:hypothetical protein SAY86_028484 [Trapa natans]|uniref:Uncharacterized protein n=1 Tax=Trapa natans TaxID=22666 RepID=A0AAN7RGF9_TRANT|nr:hypothetical protein SAY86_028484 [Trapa natans]
MPPDNCTAVASGLGLTENTDPYPSLICPGICAQALRSGLKARVGDGAAARAQHKVRDCTLTRPSVASKPEMQWSCVRQQRWRAPSTLEGTKIEFSDLHMYALGSSH